jgi:hypothetical protein
MFFFFPFLFRFSQVESQLFEALNLNYFQGSWIDLGTPTTTREDTIVAPYLPRVVDSSAFLALLLGAGGVGGGATSSESRSVPNPASKGETCPVGEKLTYYNILL